jgi:Ca2+-binding RTX toxin-like protein
MKYLAGFVIVSAIVAFGPQGTARGDSAPVTCMGRTVTIMGTPGPDDLEGQAHVSDVIYGGGGNDFIFGGFDGNAVRGGTPDYLCGGPGNDHIEGDAGNDHINGGDGGDEIEGYDGDDVERGNAGADFIHDESCSDSCDAGTDVVLGGTGNDRLITGYGNDRVEGGAGADSIIDEECSPSILLGGRGDDYIESWTSSIEGYGAYTCADDTFPSRTADTVKGGRGTDSSKDDVDDVVTKVEHVQRVHHGQFD